MEDYADYLDDQVRALSYENLSTQPEKFTDRIVRYEGHVLDVSGTDPSPPMCMSPPDRRRTAAGPTR